jgi:Flp pilus assembly protein TadD
MPATPLQTPPGLVSATIPSSPYNSTLNISNTGTGANATGSLRSQPTAIATATAQMSPTTSGHLSLTEAEQQRQQQCTMLLRQARRLIQMQNPGEAFNAIENILQIDPVNVNALILKGQLLGTIGRFAEAMSAVQQVLQLDPDHALVWSMKAALLTNMGQYQEALQAVEQSLELDPNNPETYAIKTRITGQMAALQTMARGKNGAASMRENTSPAAFFISPGLQLLGLILGSAGAALPIFQPNLPVSLAFALEGFGLALLCVYAARGAYLYGFASFILTLFFCIMPAAVLGGLYKFGLSRIIQSIADHGWLLIPYLFLGLWLAAGAVLPSVLALCGLIGGIAFGVRRKNKRKKGGQK